MATKNKTSSRRWFLDPTLEAKEMSKWFSASDSPGMLMKRLSSFTKDAKNQTKHTKNIISVIYIYMCAYISYSYLICLLEICWRSCFMINLYLFFLCNSESGIQLQQHQEHQPSGYYCIARGNEVCYLWLHSMKEEELVTTSAKETSEWMWSHDGPFLLAEFSRFRRC